MERVSHLYRASASVAAIVSLVAFNALPLVGVLFWGWDLATILVLYWLENGIVGLLNIPKIVLARGPTRFGVPGSATRIELGSSFDVVTRWQSVVLVPFFVLHYGLFWLVHGVFVFVLASGVLVSGVVAGSPPSEFGFDFANAGPDWSAVTIGAIGLFVSHVASFALNFVGRGEFRRVSPSAQMFAPYGRVIVLHVTIIFGAFAVALLGASAGPIAVLVIVKNAIDVAAHLAERRRAADRVVVVG